MAYSKKQLERFVWDYIWKGEDFDYVWKVAARMGYTANAKLLKNIYDKLYQYYAEKYGEKMKRTVTVNESQLRSMISESISKVLNEYYSRATHKKGYLPIEGSEFVDEALLAINFAATGKEVPAAWRDSREIVADFKKRMGGNLRTMDGKQFDAEELEASDPVLQELSQASFNVTYDGGEEPDTWDCPGSSWCDVEDDEGLLSIIESEKNPVIKAALLSTYAVLVENGYPDWDEPCEPEPDCYRDEY